LRTDTGEFSATLTDGAIDWRGTTVLEGDSMRISVAGAQASLAAQNTTTLTTDVGDMHVSLARGPVSLQGSTTWRSAGDMSLAMQGLGALTLSGASTLQAGTVHPDADLSIHLAQGDVVMSQASSLRASQDLQLGLDQGSWRTSGASTLQAGRDLLVDVKKGQTTLSERSILDAGRDLSLQTEQGLNASGLTDVLAGGDVRVGVDQGSVILNNTSNLRALAGDVWVSVVSGHVRILDDSRWLAGGDMGVAIGTGNFSALGNTTWQAGRDVRMTITNGSLLNTQRTEVSAGRDVVVSLGQGDISLNDVSSWQAGRDQAWEIREAGAFTMADAQTELVAGNNIALDMADDVRLDWLQAGQTLSIRSARGAVLDNTLAETDLMTARHLVLDAATGLGINWGDNLNTRITDTITAINRSTGGINLQNWVGLSIGEQGVRNLGEGNVMLVSGATLNHGPVLYQSQAGPSHAVINLPGQKIYLIHNLPNNRLLEQWGNRQVGFVEVRTSVPATTQFQLPAYADLSAQLRPASLLQPSDEEDAFDAADRLLRSAQQSAARTIEAYRPIRLAEVLRHEGDPAMRHASAPNFELAISDLSTDLMGLLQTALTVTDAQGNRLMPTEQVDLLQDDDSEPTPLPMPSGKVDSKPASEWAERPVLREAMQLADDELDLPLIDAMHIEGAQHDFFNL
jgi:hypothetical protein